MKPAKDPSGRCEVSEPLNPFPYYLVGYRTMSEDAEHFVERKRLLDAGGVVITPQGKPWDSRAIWQGGQGGPPAGSMVVQMNVPHSRAPELIP